jgi:hypothetical protein
MDPATFRFVAQCFNHCATKCLAHIQVQIFKGSVVMSTALCVEESVLEITEESAMMKLCVE